MEYQVKVVRIREDQEDLLVYLCCDDDVGELQKLVTAHPKIWPEVSDKIWTS